MPYKDKEAQRKANRERMQRVRQGNTKQDTVLPVTPPDVLPNYHPIMHWLVDKDKRKKLEAIVERLEDKKLLGKVYYGAGQDSIDFVRVSQLLDATT